MKQTWRWFGPDDPVTLAHARQAGATGIVTALHHLNDGRAWPADEIARRKAEVEDALGKAGGRIIPYRIAREGLRVIQTK